MPDKIYPRAVKERTIEAAVALMLRVGCEVTEIRDGDRLTLDVVVPADSADPHGDRLLAVLNTE